ncbi:hypothetical protein GQ43DRAFT_496416 [Delitschia confertaspora ATCC 74209]|uniref:GATA-type domain-containing protein n=1 Tax=Delitschia confertaspora ATCC 74209 TaxID=1513339 RepID=A0A9P4MRT5_9PLEO|nr:hypothetical protein GQ43DRAFT_496416 [Delitschia confertaspora ATCC 74209]
METMDSSNRQSVGLPSINHFNSEKIKREEVEHQRKHSVSAMISPSYPFPGPPHSFSNHQSSAANSVQGTLGGLLSPPESRRTSGDGDEKERRAPARQSLPSIHEALGGSEPALSYPAPPPSAPVSVAQPYHPPSTATSPSDQRIRAYSTTDFHSQGPPNPYSRPRSPYMSAPAIPAPPPPPPPPPETQGSPLPRPAYPPVQHNPKLPTLHPLRTTQSPPSSSTRPNPYTGYPPPPPSAYEPAPQSAGPMNSHYGYGQYLPQYPLSAPPPSGPGSAYPHSATYVNSAPPARYNQFPSFRSDNGEPGRVEEIKKPYGENVKRHLESFDLEASLNEMAEGAGRITDFSKNYGQRAHDTARIGMPRSSMPRLEEVDDMLKQSEKIQMSLQRMREVVFNHQQADMMDQKQDSRYRPVNGYEHEGTNNYHEEGKGTGGFAGADTKKRRGRAAPPGRCHSCNRAETPEWRRGPDGARTLCNACGLHYAKLTRKMGGNKPMTSSNIRPKSLAGDGAPGV